MLRTHSRIHRLPPSPFSPAVNLYDFFSFFFFNSPISTSYSIDTFILSSNLSVVEGMGYGVTRSAMRKTSQGESYSIVWHLVSSFAILAAAFLGILLPLLGKRVKSLQVDDYVYSIGKSLATGVVLGVALVHMLLPGNESLSSEELPSSIRQHTQSLAFTVSVLSIMAMHSLEVLIRSRYGHHSPPSSGTRTETSHLLRSHLGEGENLHPTEHLENQETDHRIVSAIFLEFGVSLHSIFVGLTVGVSHDVELLTLVAALCLHQFFEGVAIASRLAEAPFSASTEYLFAAIFILSAPLGAAIGVMFVTEHLVSTSGASYLLTQGILDSVCAGILLYIGFQLLFIDFYKDLETHGRTLRFPGFFKFSMLSALWIGAGVMIAIGRYL